MRKSILILAMVVGALLFFMGGLGVLNDGFREEIPGAPLLLIVGLVVMVAITLADRQKKQAPEVVARNRNRTSVKSVMILIAVIAGAFGVETLWKQQAGTWVNGILLIGLALACCVAAYKLHRRDRDENEKL